MVARSVEPTYGGSAAAALGMFEVIEEFADVTFISVTNGPATTRSNLVLFQADRVGGRIGRSRSMHKWLNENVCDFDLVLINSVFDGTAVDSARAAYCAGVPYLIWPHGSLDPNDLKKHSAAKWLLSRRFWRRLIGRSAGLVFASEREARVAITFKQEVSRTVLDLPMRAVPERAGDKEEARKSLRLPLDVPIVLFLGRVDNLKGIPLLLEAIADPALSGTHLAIAGRGDAGSERLVKSETRRVGLDDRVHWLGWLTGEMKTAAFDSADCFALVSKNENFGIAAVEAIQHGCPVLISEGVNIADELAAAGAAMVVPRLTEAIVPALSELLRHPEQVLAPRQLRIAFARDRWSPVGLRVRYENLCSHVVSRSAEQDNRFI